MSLDRPSHLSEHNAAAFQLPGVVAAYHLRTPYPSTLWPLLLSLACPAGGPALELGCGTGEIARAIAAEVSRVDAVDVSARMLERARNMPGGDHALIRWIRGRAEDVPLDPPYALAIAGDSLHWMTWESYFPGSLQRSPQMRSWPWSSRPRRHAPGRPRSVSCLRAIP